MGDNPRRRLDSWKAIAGYLGRDTRTVMRWEKRAGMPVHRVPGPRSGRSVFAYPDELDRWLAAGREPPVAGNGAAAARADQASVREALPFGRRGARKLGLIVVVAAVLLVGLSVFGQRLLGLSESTAVIARVEATMDTVIARGPDGEVLWSFPHRLGYGFESPGYSRLIDLRSDGENEVLLAVNAFDPARSGSLQGELYALTRTGEVLWQLTLDDRVEFGAGTFTPPWVSLWVTPVRIAGEPMAAWSTHDITWWPSVLVLVDAHGRVKGRFVNSGWITRVRGFDAPDGDRMLASGISNSRSAAMLAVLDGRDINGTSPEEPGSPFECLDCPDGRPLRYIVFPQSEVSRASGVPYNEVAQVEVTDGNVSVKVLEGPRLSDVMWVYKFSHRFELLSVTPGDTYWTTHRSLRLEGKLDHDEEECPERTAPPISVWTPEGGWTEMVALQRP